MFIKARETPAVQLNNRFSELCYLLFVIYLLVIIYLLFVCQAIDFVQWARCFGFLMPGKYAVLTIELYIISIARSHQL